MLTLIILTISILVLGILFFRRKAANTLRFTPAARWLFWAGLFALGLYAVFWIGMGIGEMSARVGGGAMHIAPGAAMLLTLWLVSKIPLEGGLVLEAQALALAAYTLLGFGGEISIRIGSLIFTALPSMLAGLLILWACALSLARPTAKTE